LAGRRLTVGSDGGDSKQALYDHYWSYFIDARKKRVELAAHPGDVHQVLADGAAKARTLAQKVLRRATVASGLA
jgi:tryptophanyl-tRNA synthetase